MKITDDKKNYIGRDLEAMASAKNYYNWIISEFGPYLKGNVAEVGAGAGTFTKYILSKDIDSLIAVEPSEEMFPILRERMKDEGKVRVHNGFFSEAVQDKPESLNTAVYINVMEHVEHDLDELKAVHKALKPGGHVCIYVPALPWLYGTFDEQVGHYRRYTKKDLREKLEAAGFEVKMLHYSDWIGILPWLVSFRILKKKDLAPGQVSIYDKLIIPLIRFQERFIKPPIGKNIWAVGKKA